MSGTWEMVMRGGAGGNACVSGGQNCIFVLKCEGVDDACGCLKRISF